VNLIFTNHAKDSLAKRDMTVRDVEWVLERPDRRRLSEGVKVMATRQKSAKWHYIVIYVPLGGDDARIITAWKEKREL
jgi:hypothetical protein